MKLGSSFVVFSAILAVAAAVSECEEQMKEKDLYFIAHICGYTYMAKLSDFPRNISSFPTCEENSTPRKFYLRPNLRAVEVRQLPDGGAGYREFDFHEDSRLIDARSSSPSSPKTESAANTSNQLTFADLEDSYASNDHILTKKGIISLEKRSFVSHSSARYMERVIADLKTGVTYKRPMGAEKQYVLEAVFDEFYVMRKLEDSSLHLHYGTQGKKVCHVIERCEMFASYGHVIQSITLVGNYTFKPLLEDQTPATSTPKPSAKAGRSGHKYCNPKFVLEHPAALLISMGLCHLLMYLLFQAIICQRIGMHKINLAAIEAAKESTAGSDMKSEDGEKKEISRVDPNTQVSQVSRVQPETSQVQDVSQVSRVNDVSQAQGVSRVSTVEPEPSEAQKSQLNSAISNSAEYQNERKVAKIVPKKSKSKEGANELLNL